MKINKAASIPLVLHDPFFSLWSSADRLNDKDTTHWSGVRQKMLGTVEVGGNKYCFMGLDDGCEPIPQTGVDVTATATTYTFENEALTLQVRFTSPLLLSDMLLVSRPCTYVDFAVSNKTEGEVTLRFDLFRDLVTQQIVQVVGGIHNRGAKDSKDAYRYAFMGRSNQQPLGGSGDRVTIDWGYIYIATKQDLTALSYDEEAGKIGWTATLSGKYPNTSFILAYDDLLSINYFGQWRRAYWTKEYGTIQNAIAAAFSDKEAVLDKAAAFDAQLQQDAEAIGGTEYAFLCNMAYRQSVAAHKLICDEEGNILFLSKENDSNGCIGTVDVSYPSMPLFLMFNTEYVKGMLRPIFRFANCEVWEEDFAPHDVGRYPYAWGQVYGVRRKHFGSLYPKTAGRVRPPLYSFPAGNDIYKLSMQMPVEECGNMLIMMAIVCMLDGNADFAKPYTDTLEKWVKYLLTYGADPGEQLCTDDFAGHLAHNTNLSVKAIIGIEAYSLLLEQLGDPDGREMYHTIAKKMAMDWENRAFAGDHYMLCFGAPETWSMKYNLVWDKIFNSGLFSQKVYETELRWYENHINTYGTPLDSRKAYTKSDWICWCAAMSEDAQQAKELMRPIADYLENTKTRVPFGDWYDSVTGRYEHFIGRSVQGGIYMPMFKRMLTQENKL